MSQDGRRADVVLTDRVIAVLAGLITILPFAFIAGAGAATLAVRMGTRGSLRGTGLMDAKFAMVVLILTASLAALALAGCRGCYQGRRSGFIVIEVLVLFSLPILVAVGPFGGLDLTSTPVQGFAILVVVVAIYAGLRLTLIGPALD